VFFPSTEFSECFHTEINLIDMILSELMMGFSNIYLLPFSHELIRF